MIQPGLETRCLVYSLVLPCCSACDLQDTCPTAINILITRGLTDLIGFFFVVVVLLEFLFCAKGVVHNSPAQFSLSISSHCLALRQEYIQRTHILTRSDPRQAGWWVIRQQMLRPDYLSQNPCSITNQPVTLGKLGNSQCLHFLFCKTEIIITPTSQRFVVTLNESMHIKHLEWHLHAIIRSSM